MVSLESEGRVVFQLDRPGARSVAVVGAFDGWHERRIPMRRGRDGTWRLYLDPGPGPHLFRYLVNGREWVLDEGDHGRTVGRDGQTRSRVYRPPLSLDPDSLAA